MRLQMMDLVPGTTEPEAGGSVENREYATKPMSSVKAADEPWDEEELHASFEQELTDRLQACRMRWNAIREPAADRIDPRSLASSLDYFPSIEPPKQRASTRVFLASTSFQLAVRLVSLALLLVLIGFDVMGMLVLSLH
jgi:hypothetical protein